MNQLATTDAALDDATDLDLPDDWLALSDPDLSEVELQLVQAAMDQPNLSAGMMVRQFENNFAQWLGRKHAVAVASGTLGTWLALRALGIGAGDEVIASLRVVGCQHLRPVASPAVSAPAGSGCGACPTGRATCNGTHPRSQRR